MQLPPLVPVPPSSVRTSLSATEWQACLDAWVTICTLYLQQANEDFASSTASHGSLRTFLASFYAALASDDSAKSFSSGSAQELKKICVKLARRELSESKNVDSLNWEYLSDLCRVRLKNKALAILLRSLWKRKPTALESTFKSLRSHVTSALDSKVPDAAETNLTRLAYIVHVSPDVGAYFITGADFLDSLITAYGKMTTTRTKTAIGGICYLCLVSLVTSETPNISTLSDHFFDLKASADKTGIDTTLLAELVTNTPLISRLRRSLDEKSAGRLHKTLDTLETYRSPSIARTRPHRKRAVSKGKSKARPDQTLQIHRMSLVTQIQDLFPDLGSGFVLRLLDEYNDNVEQATAHLLDDSLPPHLQSLDRTETAAIDTPPNPDSLIPHSTPPPPPQTQPYIPQRHNVFDNDAFDRLAIPTSQLHLGKKPTPSHTPDPPPTTQKAAILSALAAFDSDDDERDDTYDIEDVGGTIDSAHPDGETPSTTSITAAHKQDALDQTLFAAYKSSPHLFGRTFDVRRGQARASLKAETGLTDEAIEGWAIMLGRDPRRAKKLEDRFSDGLGALQQGGVGGGNRQTELARTKYSGEHEVETSDTEGSGVDAVPGSSRGGRGGRGVGGRGRGGFRGGRGGGAGTNVSGPSNDPATANAQRRKEANKGSRANHNRRDQRARKMARGGFPG